MVYCWVCGIAQNVCSAATPGIPAVLIPYPRHTILINQITVSITMDNQRIFLFLALSVILMLLWQAWQQDYGAPQQAPTPGITQQEQSDPRRSVPEAPQPSTTTSQQATPSVTQRKQGRRIQVKTDLIEVTIDTQGGDLRSLKLLQHPLAADKPEQAFELLSDKEGDIFIAQSGLLGVDRKAPDHNVSYNTKQYNYELASGQNDLEVKLTWRGPDGVGYSKRYIFHRDSYVIDVHFDVDNRSASTWQGYLYAHFERENTGTSSGLFRLPTYTGGAIYTPTDHYQKIDFDDMQEADLKRESEGGWVAMLQHYFVGAWMPPQKTSNLFYTTDLRNGLYRIGYRNAAATDIVSGQQGTISAQLYVGPKEQERLNQLPAAGMDLTVDYGWLTFLSSPLFVILSWIHAVVGNWGWAIVLLTLLIKLAFFPLSAASYKSMANMRRIAPRMKSLKERHKDDKQAFNQAMMEMYRTEKINPLGGCLPILIQIPVFLALYWVLLESVEMRHAPFALWINDLSSPDPFYVLPILMGISMFLQQKLNPAPMDPMQQKIMSFLPIMFTVFFLFFPAGLVLYWVVNNVLSIAQQWQITRSVEAKETKKN